MELPQQLAAALGAVDEDYLIGLCNKGTVNRAKKDLAALSAPQIEFNEESAVVRWNDVECVIRSPLGESSCSCPSSSICRHRIAAILWLQQNGRQQTPSDSTSGEESANAPRKFEELAAYPTEKLLRQLGTKQISSVLFRLESGSLPQINRTSVVTVEMPWIPATVRLLEPLEHSTCTCHSKSFCLHKAQALLYWKIAEGMVDADTLKETLHTSESSSREEGKGVCQAVQEMLSAQMTTGLSRMPDTVCDTVERMASLCHTARLPNLERALRRLHREYTRYFGRSALYRDTRLLQRLAQVFRLAQQLEQAEEGTYQKLAGEFRDEYLNAGSLQLYLLAQRTLSGSSGYSGVIYYFWERQKHCFYTLNQLRPVQEGQQRRWNPLELVWGMPCALPKVIHCTLRLEGAKISGSGKLSSTEQCVAVPKRAENPWDVFCKEEIFTDFAELLHTRSGPHLPENQRLAIICPRRCIPQKYDTVRQVFSMVLLDEEGRAVYLEATYRQGEETVDWLEKTAEKIRANPRLRPAFFGAVYREEDKLKLFPIDIITDWRGRDE